MKWKILSISLIISVLFSLLATLSDISFQWEFFKIKFFLKNFAFIGIPILISSSITYYSSARALRRRKKEDESMK